MTDNEHYDAIIIGSGQGGGPLSTALVAAGRRTALIEREYIGGTCINVGCTPTKTMVASGRVAYLASRSPEYGVETGTRRIDLEVVRRRKRDIVETFRNGSREAILKGGVDIVMGHARFTDPRTIEVQVNDGGSRRLTADAFFIDTGSRPSAPPIPGLDDVPYLTSTTIMELDAVPEHLLVLGGGYIGLEFGQMFRRFGSNVTIVERAGQLVEREDEDIAREIERIFTDDGIELVLNATVKKVEPGESGGISLSAGTADGERTLIGSHILVAAGRTINTDDLGVEAAGLELDKRGVLKVNERLETTVPGIYGIGEAAGTPAFTHMVYDDFRILRDNLLHNGNRTTGDRLTPYTMFIDPQLGRVGLSEREARATGQTYKLAKIPMSRIARALETAETRGMIKALIDPVTEQILGCAVLGMEGGEVMAMLQIAMMGNMPYTTLNDGIFAHPTLAEGMNTLFSSLEE